MGKFTVSYSAWYKQVPEFELEGLWGCAIENGLYNTLNGTVPKADANDVNFDVFIKSVSIPQLKLEAESTTFGLINYTGKSAYDNVTLEFYDDINGTCLNFFNNWLGSVYDNENNAFRANWRYEDKDIFVEYYRKIRSDKINGKIILNSDTMKIKPIVQYHLIRCLPISIDSISAEEGGGERKTFSVTLATQRVINNFGKDIATKCDNDLKEEPPEGYQDSSSESSSVRSNPDTSYENTMKNNEPVGWGKGNNKQVGIIPNFKIY